MQDVDDPLTGYFVRDKDSKLQGFITCTTFTNWQKTFRWDSVHDSTFSYDDAEMAQQMLNGERAFDTDGSLAAQLQQTVRCGDPWNEGIVWPQLAEISLLGGLGCGKALLALVIEQLETMKPTAKQNYDYVVLQATENSIPFYESMGFIRVGALTIDDEFKKKQQAAAKQDEDTESEDSAPVANPVDPSSPADSEDSLSEIVSSPVTEYVVEKPGESPSEIAKKFKVSAWDIVFLNHYLYKDLNSRSRLIKGTKIFIPSQSEAKADAYALAKSPKDLEGESSAPRWYIARENDTPKMIARKFGVICKELVLANIERLPGLLALSRLKEGTRIKVSHFHLHEDQHVPYCHWTFPDDSFENGEPSYMMARKLNRRTGAAAKDRPVQSSFAVPISKHVRPPSALFHEVIALPKTPKTVAKNKGKQVASSAVEIPGKPKRPLSSYVIFCNEHRDILQRELAGKPASEHSKVLASRWRELDEKDKAGYLKKHEAAKKEYEKALTKYESNLARFFEKHPDLRPEPKSADEDPSQEGGSLFNKVVTVKEEALRGLHREFKYFYVLTFIPDLMWCHLVPMRQVGSWGSDKPKCEGRPIWMLVDESEGKELDISASFCQRVKSRGMKRTADADEEQWDIPSSGTDQKVAAKVLDDWGQPNDSAKKPSSVAGAPKKKVAPVKSASKSIKRKRESLDSAAPPPQKKGKAFTKSEESEPSGPTFSERQLNAVAPLSQKKGTALEKLERSDPDSASSSKRRPSPKKKGKTLLVTTSEVRREHEGGRTTIRDVPRRKAAPSGVGVLSEAKSPPSEKASPSLVKTAPRKPPSKKGKIHGTVENEAASITSKSEFPPPKEGSPKDISDRKAHAAKNDVTGRRAPRKTLKKRGGRSPKKSYQESKVPIATSPRPRRHAAAASLSCELAQPRIRSLQGEGMLAVTTAESDADSIPVANLGCPLSKSGKKALQDKEQEQHSTPEKRTSAVRSNSSPRPTKRTRTNEQENGGSTCGKKRLRTETEPLKDTTPYRRFPNRRDPTIFAEKPQLGISSPLLMGRRLIIS